MEWFVWITVCWMLDGEEICLRSRQELEFPSVIECYEEASKKALTMLPEGVNGKDIKINCWTFESSFAE